MNLTLSGLRSFPVILSLLFVPLALAEPLVTYAITDAETTPVFRAMGELGSLRTPEEFKVAPVEGVIQVGNALGSEVQSMRLFAKAHPTTFVLTAEVNGNSTPMFDGVVLGEMGHPIANFSLKTLTSEDISDIGGRVLRRMERYSDPAHWAFALRKALLGRIMDPPEEILPDGRIEKKWPLEILVTTPKRHQVFQRTFGAFQTMARFFGLGTGRPNWALLDLTALPPLSKERIARLSEAWTLGKPQRLVLILNADRIYTLHAGKWESHPVSCAMRL